MLFYRGQKPLSDVCFYCLAEGAGGIYQIMLRFVCLFLFFSVIAVDIVFRFIVDQRVCEAAVVQGLLVIMFRFIHFFIRTENI